VRNNKQNSHIFIARFDATHFDSYTEHVLMAALLDVISRKDAVSLLIITCKWNWFPSMISIKN